MQIMAGSFTKALAMATRCCWPPDSWETAFFSCSSDKSSFNAIARTFRSISCLPSFLIFRPKAILSYTVMVGNSA